MYGSSQSTRLSGHWHMQSEFLFKTETLLQQSLVTYNSVIGRCVEGAQAARRLDSARIRLPSSSPSRLFFSFFESTTLLIYVSQLVQCPRAFLCFREQGRSDLRDPMPLTPGYIHSLPRVHRRAHKDNFNILVRRRNNIVQLALNER